MDKINLKFGIIFALLSVWTFYLVFSLLTNLEMMQQALADPIDDNVWQEHYENLTEPQIITLLHKINYSAVDNRSIFVITKATYLGHPFVRVIGEEIPWRIWKPSKRDMIVLIDKHKIGMYKLEGDNKQIFIIIDEGILKDKDFKEKIKAANNKLVIENYGGLTRYYIPGTIVEWFY